MTHNFAEVSREDEWNLVIRIKTGDQTACHRLVELFGPRMTAVARRYMRCEDDCNDAVQDAFISAFKGLDRFGAHARLSTWLQRITVNACLMKLRRGSYRREMSIEELLPAISSGDGASRRSRNVNDPSIEIENDETRSAVRQAIDQLPDAYRTVLLLRDIEEMGSVATAGFLATTENNVKMRLRRGRQALRSLLEPMMANAMMVST